MADIQKREEDGLEEYEEKGLPKVVYWLLLAATFLAVGVVVVFFGPWLLTAALVLGGGYAVWRLASWWLSEDEEIPSASETLLDSDDRDAELDSEIALEDLRDRVESDTS